MQWNIYGETTVLIRTVLLPKVFACAFRIAWTIFFLYLIQCCWPVMSLQRENKQLFQRFRKQGILPILRIGDHLRFWISIKIFPLVWLKNVWGQDWKPSNPMTKSDFVFRGYWKTVFKSMEWSVPMCASLNLWKPLWSYWLQCVVWCSEGARGFHMHIRNV